MMGRRRLIWPSATGPIPFSSISAFRAWMAMKVARRLRAEGSAKGPFWRPLQATRGFRSPAIRGGWLRCHLIKPVDQTPCEIFLRASIVTDALIPIEDSRTMAR